MPPFDSEFLRAAILIASPLILVALGELISEIAGGSTSARGDDCWSGVRLGFLAGRRAREPVGFGLSVRRLAGVLLAVIMAFASIQAGADQIVVGVALNILGAGLSAFAFQKYSQNQPDLFIDRMQRLEIPGLKEIPVIGPALFSQIPLVYIALLLAHIVGCCSQDTWRSGMRAAGELSEAGREGRRAERAGHCRWQGDADRWRLRRPGVLSSIGLAGSNGMTAGEGFLLSQR